MSDSDVAHLCSYPPLDAGLGVYKEGVDGEGYMGPGGYDRTDDASVLSRWDVSVFHSAGRTELVYLLAGPLS